MNNTNQQRRIFSTIYSSTTDMADKIKNTFENIDISMGTTKKKNNEPTTSVDEKKNSSDESVEIDLNASRSNNESRSNVNVKVIEPVTVKRKSRNVFGKMGRPSDGSMNGSMNGSMDGTDTEREHTMNSLYVQDRYNIVGNVMQEVVDHNVTYVTNRELDSLLSDVKDLKYIQQDMAMILDNQSLKLEQIDKSVDNTVHNIKRGNKELDKALKYKNDGIINVVGVTTGALCGSFFGPPGAVVGAGVGLVATITINAIR